MRAVDAENHPSPIVMLAIDQDVGIFPGNNGGSKENVARLRLAGGGQKYVALKVVQR